MSFKTGDQVECVDFSRRNGIPTPDWLIKGKIYTVLAVKREDHDERLVLEGLEEKIPYASRFKISYDITKMNNDEYDEILASQQAFEDQSSP